MTRKDKHAEKPAPGRGADGERGTNGGRRADEGGEAADAAARWKRLPKGGPSKVDQKRYRQILVTLQEKLSRSSQNLADEALKASGQDFSVDHMADHGTDNFDQDFSLKLLEGETEVMRDIEDAIAKIDGKRDLPFGLCEGCADEILSRGPEAVAQPWIPKGRLDVLPYARLCVLHQEKEEGSAR
jgi:DnaK suppressor protein